MALKMVGIKTVYLQAYMTDEDQRMYIILPVGVEGDSGQVNKLWRLMAWLYGLRLSPRGWHGTIYSYCLEVGFVASTADPCLYNFNDGQVLLLLHVDGILLSGVDEEVVCKIIELLRKRGSTR